MSKQYTLKDLELPDDEPMVIIRKSFLWICDGDKYAAATLNMYVHWTKWIMKHRPVAQEINRQLKKQGKKASQDTSLILYRKQKDLVKDLLNFCNEKRLRQANEFLEAKGLLKIDATPRSNLDHVLKYELQIDVFKQYMEDWREQREHDEQGDDEMVEMALEADSLETDNSPSRNGQKSAPKQTIVGSEADNSPSLNKNIDNVRDKPRDDKERKNAEPRQQKANVSTQQEATHSSTHSSSKISFSSSKPEKQIEEVPFTEEEQRIYDYGQQILFRATPPTKTAKLKDECAKLAEHVKTFEQFQSLLQFVRGISYIKGQIHFKNLVNGLNGWLLQMQQTSNATQRPSVLVSKEITERNKARRRARIREKELAAQAGES
jgi:hypothetical protein